MSGAPDPRVGLAAGMVLGAAALAGPASAAATLVLAPAAALASGVAPRALARRLAPPLAAFAGLALVFPFAPGPVADAALRGASLATATAIASGAVPWSAALGLAGAAGLPRTAVAFLAILARHLEAVRGEALAGTRALLLRGGFDRWQGFPASARLLLLRTFPAALARADRSTDALALRGFTGRIPPPPPYLAAFRSPGFAARRLRADGPWLAAAAGGAIALLWQWGVGR